MSKKVWNNLKFYLTDIETGDVLRFGENTGQFELIQKSEDLFSALQTYAIDEDEGRTIPIPLYLNNMTETSTLNNFLNPKKKYNLQIIKDSTNYYTQCKIIEPELTGCDDLYGDKSKLIVYTVNLQLLNNKDYFLSDLTNRKSVGAGFEEYFKYGKYYALPLDIDNFIFSLREPLHPVSILNIGGDSNGIYMRIKPNSLLLNPVIKNVTTGFAMKLLITAKVNDVLEIDTNDKYVRLNGKDFYNVKQIQDKWLVLEKGNNTISFEADSGAEDAEVELSYRNKYRGL